MARYYIVGSATRLYEQHAELTGLVTRGYTALATVTVRPMSPQFIMDYSFTDKKITRVFTDYNDAVLYAQSISRSGTHPKGAYPYNMGADAPVVTVEMDHSFSINSRTTHLLSLHDPHSHNSADKISKEVSYYKTDLTLDDTIKCIRAEFPTAPRVETVEFVQTPKSKCTIQ